MIEQATKIKTDIDFFLSDIFVLLYQLQETALRRFRNITKKIYKKNSKCW